MQAIQVSSPTPTSFLPTISSPTVLHPSFGATGTTYINSRMSSLPPILPMCFLGSEASKCAYQRKAPRSVTELTSRVAVWIDGNLIADFQILRLRDVNTLKIDQVTLTLFIYTNSLPT